MTFCIEKFSTGDSKTSWASTDIEERIGRAGVLAIDALLLPVGDDIPGIQNMASTSFTTNFGQEYSCTDHD